jgi:hypothetical protein
LLIKEIVWELEIVVKPSKGIGAPGGIVIPMKMFVEPRKKSHHANDREKAGENRQPNLKS